MGGEREREGQQVCVYDSGAIRHEYDIGCRG